MNRRLCGMLMCCAIAMTCMILTPGAAAQPQQEHAKANELTLTSPNGQNTITLAARDDGAFIVVKGGGHSKSYAVISAGVKGDDLQAKVSVFGKDGKYPVALTADRHSGWVQLADNERIQVLTVGKMSETFDLKKIRREQKHLQEVGCIQCAECACLASNCQCEADVREILLAGMVPQFEGSPSVNNGKLRVFAVPRK